MRWVRLASLVLLLVVVATGALVAGANAIVIVGGATNGDSRAPVALVLGAGLRAGGHPTAMLEDRLRVAALLYHDRRVEKVLASGDHGQHDHDEVGAMRASLVRMGVADEDVFTDHAGFDTWSSMVRARKVFGATKVIVVTQRFHLARAIWLARRAGLEADGVPADAHDYGSKGRAASVREVLARVKAVGEVIVGREPKYLGPPIDLAGDGRTTRG